MEFFLKVIEKPSYDEEQPHKEEVKHLPSSLRYGFLGPNSAYSVIVNASLNACQVDSLLRVLSEHQKAIRYALDDLKEIHPSVCMHRILMEDDISPQLNTKEGRTQMCKRLSRRKF